MLALVLVAALTAPPADAHARARRLVDRAQMCLHWGGEEAYSAERRRQIDRGFAAAGCARIHRDARRFLRGRPAPKDAAAVRRALRELG